MTETINWRDAVRVARAGEMSATVAGPSGGRATAFEFAGTGGVKTWIGRVAMAPGARTGAHRHGRHEAALFVIAGSGRILWGERLEFRADVAPGDFIYFAPHVPHEEVNLDGAAPREFVVVRSDGERIVQPFEIEPENVF